MILGFFAYLVCCRFALSCEGGNIVLRSIEKLCVFFQPRQRANNMRRVLASSPPVEAFAIESDDRDNDGRRPGHHHVHVFDTSVPECAAVFCEGRFYGVKASVYSVAICDLFVAAGCSDGRIHIFSVADHGRQLYEFQAHIDVVSSLAFDTTHDELDEVEAETGAAAKSVSGGASWSVPLSAVMLVSASLDSSVRFWSCAARADGITEIGLAPSRQPPQLQSLHHRADVNCVAVPNSRVVMSAGDDSTIRLWTKQRIRDVRTGDEHLVCFAVTHCEQTRGTCRTIACSGPFHVAVGLSTGKVAILDLRKPFGSKIIAELDGAGSSAPITAIAYSPHRKVNVNDDDHLSTEMMEIAVANDVGEIRFFERTSFHCTEKMNLHDDDARQRVKADHSSTGSAKKLTSICKLEYVRDGCALIACSNNGQISVLQRATVRKSSHSRDDDDYQPPSPAARAEEEKSSAVAAAAIANTQLASVSGVAGTLHCACLSRDGRVLITGSDERALFSFFLAFGRPLGPPFNVGVVAGAAPGHVQHHYRRDAVVAPTSLNASTLLATLPAAPVRVVRMTVAGDGAVECILSTGQCLTRSRAEMMTAAAAAQNKNDRQEGEDDNDGEIDRPRNSGDDGDDAKQDPCLRCNFLQQRLAVEKRERSMAENRWSFEKEHLQREILQLKMELQLREAKLIAAQVQIGA